MGGGGGEAGEGGPHHHRLAQCPQQHWLDVRTEEVDISQQKPLWVELYILCIKCQEGLYVYKYCILWASLSYL